MYGVVFDVERIQLLLNDLYFLTHIKMNFVSSDRKITLNTLKSQTPGNEGIFCDILRKDIRADSKCMECDRNAFATACKNRSTYIYECHAGLTEVLTPVILEGKPLGYIITGKILASHPSPQKWDEVYDKCRQYDVDFAKLEKSFYALHFMERKKIHAIMSIADMCSKYIYISELAKIREPFLIERIKEYIEENYDSDISLSTMSEYLKISKSHISHTMKTNMDISFSNFLLQKRIEKAKSMIEKTNLKMREISLKTGFSDHNYFSRAFKKMAGCSPTEYRKK